MRVYMCVSCPRINAPPPSCCRSVLVVVAVGARRGWRQLSARRRPRHPPGTSTYVRRSPADRRTCGDNRSGQPHPSFGVRRPLHSPARADLSTPGHLHRLAALPSLFVRGVHRPRLALGWRARRALRPTNETAVLYVGTLSGGCAISGSVVFVFIQNHV